MHESSAVDTVRSLLGGGYVHDGDPQWLSGLTLVPLFVERAPSVAYMLLASAVRGGVATVEEVGGGSVPTLRVVNQGALPLLLVDGEHLIGLKQNRILNTTVLVPEKSALDIPVSCVEQGRWGASRGKARPASPVLFPEARAKKAEDVTASVRQSGEFRADQAYIWQKLKSTFRKLGMPPLPTEAMQGAYEHLHTDLAKFSKTLGWREGQAGVVALHGERILCADLFDRPQTLRDLWDRLIPSYAVAVLAEPTDRGASQRAAQAFLRGAAKAHITEHTAIGRGTDLRLTGDGVVGSALVVDAAVVHLALFESASTSAARLRG